MARTKGKEVEGLLKMIQFESHCAMHCLSCQLARHSLKKPEALKGRRASHGAQSEPEAPKGRRASHGAQSDLKVWRARWPVTAITSVGFRQIQQQ